jgi:hypothetical protein
MGRKATSLAGGTLGLPRFGIIDFLDSRVAEVMRQFGFVILKGDKDGCETADTYYKRCLLNTTQLAWWMKTGSPKAKKHDIRWA